MSFQENQQFIRDIHETGLQILKEHCSVTEREVPEMFRTLNAGDMEFQIRQFHVDGIGNLTLMKTDTSEHIMMTTFIISPFCRDIPLFTSDYILQSDRLAVLNEVYALMCEKGSAYEKAVQQFRENMERCPLEQIPVNPEWYDDIRPTFAYRKGTQANKPEIMKLFTENLHTLLACAEELPLLQTKEEKQQKWNCVYEYATKPVEMGGISTNVFKQTLGEEKTKEFFYQVFFGTALYQNSES